ncbi:MAG: hypothetical protein K1X83_13105 [Oligoflexia bacterium]|nr:hypothetical protein [Oligoflexia bacterium]
MLRRTIKKHDDIDLGLSVSVMLALALIAFLLLPVSPSLAQTVLIGSLVAFAIWVALFDYRT